MPFSRSCCAFPASNIPKKEYYNPGERIK